MHVAAQHMSTLHIRPACIARHRSNTSCLLPATCTRKHTTISSTQQRTRRTSVSINALSVDDVLGVSGTAVLTTVLLAAVGYSALPLLLQGRTSNAEVDQGDINDQDIKWTVMGIISCLPFVNWTAWIFAAIDDPDAASRYYLFAALYGLPLLTEGLSLDGLLLGATALCALHVQVERVACSQASNGQLLDDDALQNARNAASQQKQLETDRVARDALPRSSDAPEDTARRRDGTVPPMEDPRRRDELQVLIDRQLQEFDARLKPGQGSKQDGAAPKKGAPRR